MSRWYVEGAWETGSERMSLERKEDSHGRWIYDATHDQETLRLEAMEAEDVPTFARPEQRRVEAILYFDDGIERTRANT